MITTTAQILTIVLTPYLAILLSQKFKWAKIVSPIVICFAVGILVCNLNLLKVDEQISGIFRDGTVLVALPMLLYSSDVNGWIKNSPTTFLAYGLCLLAGFIGSGVASYLFVNQIQDIWVAAGMLVGIYSGGTPNLFAVGVALEAGDEVFTLVNSSVIFWGAIYLLFIMTIGRLFFAKFLTRYINKDVDEVDNPQEYMQYSKISIRDSFIAVIITLLIVLFSVGVSHLIFGKLEPILIIVFVTTIAILLSLSENIRTLQGPFEIGDYMLLMFGVAVGMISDFEGLVREGGYYIFFVALVLLITVGLHALFCRLANIDRDTFIITSAAGIFGPVFITQIASSLRNRSIIIGGMAVALIGLALGNYLGIGIGYLLQFLLN